MIMDNVTQMYDNFAQFVEINAGKLSLDEILRLEGTLEQLILRNSYESGFNYDRAISFTGTKASVLGTVAALGFTGLCLTNVADVMSLPALLSGVTIAAVSTYKSFTLFNEKEELVAASEVNRAQCLDTVVELMAKQLGIDTVSPEQRHIMLALIDDLSDLDMDAIQEMKQHKVSVLESIPLLKLYTQSRLDGVSEDAMLSGLLDLAHDYQWKRCLQDELTRKLDRLNGTNPMSPAAPLAERLRFQLHCFVDSLTEHDQARISQSLHEITESLDSMIDPFLKQLSLVTGVDKEEYDTLLAVDDNAMEKITKTLTSNLVADWRNKVRLARPDESGQLISNKL